MTGQVGARNNIYLDPSYLLVSALSYFRKYSGVT